MRAYTPPAMDGAQLSITMLGSGSSGNAAIVQFGSLTRRVVLLDAGLSPRKVREGLLHRCPPGTELGAILLTHLDGDHWHRGWCAQLARRGVPWLLVTLLVAAAGSGLGAAASAQGTSWTPYDAAPFSDVRLPSWL